MKERTGFKPELYSYKRGKNGKKMSYPFYNDFSALKKPFHEVFFEVGNKGFIPPLVEMRLNPNIAESKEFCKFHKPKGHGTKDCW